MMLALLLSASLALQDTATARLAVPATVDSTGVLTFDAFSTEVLADHPVVRQARLLDERARAEILAAKGGVYDPTVSAAWSRKVFSATEYYDYVDAALKVPTPIGIDLKLGYEQSAGAYINPDRRTPSSGLFVAGVTIPLGRGLVTDSRRNALAQAKALGTLASAERQAAVNKLLYSATRDYAAWFEAWRRRAIIREGVALAQFRAEAVTRRLANGDAAAIDTVEAGLEYQRRLVALLEADNDWYLATQAINAYLWDAQATPVDLAPGIVPSVRGLEPEPLDTAAVGGWLSQAMLRHPDLAKALAKLQQEQANRRFYGQDLLPEIELEAAALRTGEGGLGAGWPDVSENYKLGAVGTTPLLLMKGRGRLDASKAKAESAELEAALVRRDVRLAVLVSVNDVLTLERILALQVEAVRQARFLRDGEQRRFENSESTLFLVNQRDRLLLDEEVKLVAYEAKYVKARGALALALGEPSGLRERESGP
ncbi:MAG: outer rane efflux protein [Gemmatimonadetes bacterium]|nr:outer rane efflux protein [Gemmatimonadota bacterium]